MGSCSNFEDEVVDEELYKAFVLAHEERLRAVAVPECKWKTLFRKLNSSIFDAGDNFVYLQESLEDDNSESDSHCTLKVYTKCAMSNIDSEHIYLIDHAWTYTLDAVKKRLEENSSLVDRMATVMEINYSDFSLDEKINNILKNMWLYNDFYIVKSGNQIFPTIDCWYILDEFGSRISYSENPSFEMVLFLFSGDNSMYSLLFPKSNVSEGAQVTVQYPTCKIDLSDDMKKALSYPWNPFDLSNMNFNLFEPHVDYFASGRYEDVLPEIELSGFAWEELKEGQFEIYSEYPDIAEYLTHSLFKVVDKKEEAKIFWLSIRQPIELVEVYPKFRFINQFPSEQVLINKDLLAAVCRRCASDVFAIDTLESYPEWLPTTFNLQTELLKFMSYFQNREKKKFDNIWICKPFNLARGMGIHITDNLAQIIRISKVRPMVACKYITDPVLFPVSEKGLVKIDLRYIVLLRNSYPLELYIYERFWIRFANKSFVLEDFNDYERHFTVMNYNDFPLQQMYCHDFIQKFEEYYESYKWSNIQVNINKMIKAIFVASTLKEPPAGIGRFPGSRAMYGLDIMLKWDRKHDVPEIKPMILEVNWMPDCKRACQYYPEFYNDIFSVLFLGDIKDKHVIKL